MVPHPAPAAVPGIRKDTRSLPLVTVMVAENLFGVGYRPGAYPSVVRASSAASGRIVHDLVSHWSLLGKSRTGHTDQHRRTDCEDFSFLHNMFLIAFPADRSQ
jgi:hypothetical protein